ncbi:6TM ABC transporter family protein [Blattabacterium cuenoti]|uniref:hypothetical protein n=1 Tax=Blattabacterium cuenoti TaxID=1653831 RepID=UPI001EEF1C4C|nr:hypothetical protein [Blattabacterium cuenoti]
MIEETLNATKIRNIFHSENQMKKRFEIVKVSEYQRRLSNRVNRKKELTSSVSEFIDSITMILIVWYGGKLKKKKELDQKSFFLFWKYFFKLLIQKKV